ncbi:GNAT family N-acetyltransferase [Rhodospirillum rubrum]|uniref:GCN5-related N-acetyltransferase n=1 Tax=Rhodospirillum rubrum (strain ATCC 11170 / ATH 1.1.1 / DSM 467 / LMG 4362 / NCIMB 8255 / S1) TaxID=269796 RepID=Q2RVT2_RHORT|nr:GNAT family N-acetyltransferase [Rhodospirillum rubrum]ABC21763.1 GCN5-related N-acetyltransferase [Rhodospirillum rubrum ATCC 11170]AEO47461.1 GCN5-related N-acetyltransferase [Rhodospirillum rubrum F11]MBK5953320.1 N-acetyltransferase [Rhodospirillum rubrum]QXG81425.1 GNAT family N-acetyltransferase [Rhodospirillum rubrum]HAP98995.1 N-acetyltransferase [Rhodospirillum rubrum]
MTSLLQPYSFGSETFITPWTDPVLPSPLLSLVADGVTEGYEWVGDFPTCWRERPFLDAGEGLFVAWAKEQDGGIPLGMACLSADPHVADPDTGRLRYIYIHPNGRNRRLAERLLQACLARARPRWRRLRLHTVNPLAARLYERYGFRPITGEARATHALDLGRR